MAVRLTRRFETMNEAVNKLADLLRRKGYDVKSANVTYTRSVALYRFKVEPAPPGRGVEKWERVTLMDGSRRYQQVSSGFSSIGRYHHTTIRAPFAQMREYIDDLPDVLEET
jgi:hypothetical protein